MPLRGGIHATAFGIIVIQISGTWSLERIGQQSTSLQSNKVQDT